MSVQETSLTGLMGFCAAGLGVLTSFQEQLEWGVRITGGMLGIIVAIATLVRLLRTPPAPKP